MATAPLTGKPTSTLHKATYAPGTYTNTLIYTVPSNTITILALASLTSTTLTVQIRGTDNLGVAYFGMTATTGGSVPNPSGISYTNVDPARLTTGGDTSFGLGNPTYVPQFYMYPGETLVLNGPAFGSVALTWFTYELSGS